MSVSEGGGGKTRGVTGFRTWEDGVRSFFGKTGGYFSTHADKLSRLRVFYGEFLTIGSVSVLHAAADFLIRLRTLHQES